VKYEVIVYYTLLTLRIFRSTTDLVTIHKNLSITAFLSQLVLVAGVTLTELPEVRRLLISFFSIINNAELCTFSDIQRKQVSV